MAILSTFESMGCVFEVKTSNFGNGAIDLDYLKRSIKKAKSVATRCARFCFLFPLNEVGEDAEIALKAFRETSPAEIKWFGPSKCENFVRALGKTNKELSKQIQKVVLEARGKEEL